MMNKMMIALTGIVIFGISMAQAAEVTYCIRFDVQARTGSAYDSAAACTVIQTVDLSSGTQVWDCTFKHDGHQAFLQTSADRFGYSNDLGGYFAENLMYFESDFGVFLFDHIGVGKVKNNSFLQVVFLPAQPRATYTQFLVKGVERDFDMTITDLFYGPCD